MLDISAFRSPDVKYLQVPFEVKLLIFLIIEGQWLELESHAGAFVDTALSLSHTRVHSHSTHSP